ncbi:Retrovirus-related Pol polyprotein from transposon TNT 1-94-like protein [Drosera capensis]
MEKHKVRLVAKGYAQQEGIDYKEVFAPLARMDKIRLIITLAMDMKLAFPSGNLEEEEYLHQPPGYEKRGQEDNVYRLKKELHCLKQEPRAYNTRIDAYFERNGF